MSEEIKEFQIEPTEEEEKNPKGKKKKKKEKEKDSSSKVKKIGKRLAIKIVGYGIFVILALQFVLGIYQVHDNDMYPALRDGDLIITYKLGGYYNGDVVVYKDNEGNTHYGRVVAIAGDEVLITEENYFAINGNIPYENIFYPTKPGTKMQYPYKVPEGEVFILGDMRQQAKDSRLFGSISINNLKGKVVLLLFRGRGF